MNVLIVEDEIIVAMDMKELIINMGYDVKGIATNYDEVMSILDKNKVDMVLMDINLEGSSKDGIDIATDIDKPVMFITAYCDDKTISRAIKCEPLGYLVKPFKESELKANLELAKYKLEISNSIIKKNKITLGDGYYFDKELDEVFFYDHLINLGKNEKKLFKLLLSAKGTIVPFATMEEEVWDGNFVNDSTRRSLIFRLKCKFEHKFIETIVGVGCKLEI